MNEQKYYFVMQIQSKYGEDWYLTSSYSYTTFEKFAETQQDQIFLDSIVAYTKIKEQDFKPQKQKNDN